MARRRLYEILSEEQEPFALQSFIRERCRPLHPLAQLRSCGSVKRRSLPSCLALSRNPFFSLQQRVLRRRKKRKKRKGGANAEEGLVSGVVDFLAKKLLARKRHIVVGGLTGVGADEEDNGSSTFNASEEAIEEAIECEVRPVSCRCGLPECPLYDGGATSPPLPASAAGLEREEKAAILSPSSPEVFCEGVAEKEQLSPVSVLDLPFYDDEEEGSRSRRDGEEDGDDDEDESFEDRLAALERTKQELLSRICSFERLASEGDGSSELEESSVARRKMELWKGADSETARKMVEADQRGEREDWRPELAAELSAAVFSALVYDLAVELCSR